MIKTIFCLLIFCFLCSCSGTGPFSIEQLRNEIKPVDFTIPEYQSWQMDNGLTVNYIYNPELPLVSGSLYTPGGSYHGSTHSRHSINALGGLMRSAGAGNLSAEALDLKLEELSAEISSGFGSENGGFSFSCLKTDLPEVFSLFADVIFRPRFEPSRVELWRSQNLESISRRWDDPNSIASIAFQQLVYQGSRFADVLDSEKVQNLKVEDLIALHKLFIKPEGATLVLSGDLSEQEARELSEKYFSNWHGKNPQAQEIIQPQISTDPGIYFIEKETEQSTVIIGQPGILKLGPEHYAIDVYNELFGAGGFSSNLVKKIRVEQGLAYVTYGAIGSDSIPSKSLVYLQTKSQTTAQAISSAIEVIKDSQLNAPSEQRVAEIIGSAEKSFVFKFDSLEESISRKSTLKYGGYPEDYYDTYLDNIRKVTADDLLRVARKYWDPERFIVLVVGNTNAYNQLADLTKQAESVFYNKPIKKLNFTEKIVP